MDEVKKRKILTLSWLRITAKEGKKDGVWRIVVLKKKESYLFVVLKMWDGREEIVFILLGYLGHRRGNGVGGLEYA